MATTSWANSSGSSAAQRAPRIASVTTWPNPPVEKMTRAACQGQPLPGLGGADEVIAERVERDDAAGPTCRVAGAGCRPGRAAPAEAVPPSALSSRRTTSETNCSLEIDSRRRPRSCRPPRGGRPGRGRCGSSARGRRACPGRGSPSGRAGRRWRGRGRRTGRPGVATGRAPTWRDDRLGDVGQLAGHVADRLAAEDVARADPHPFLVAEAQRIGARSSAPLHSSASSALIAAAGWARSTTSESIRSSIMPGLLIRISERNWLVAHSST